MASPLQARLTAAMKRAGINATILCSPENVTYSAGVYIVSQRMIRERLLYTVYPQEGEPFVVVSSVVANTVRRKSWITELHVYTEHQEEPTEKLVSVLREKRLTAGRMWLETGYLAARYYSTLSAELQDVEFIDCERTINEQRLTKTEYEIGLLGSAVRRAEKAIHYAYMLARPGDTEKSVSDRMVEGHIKLGADYVPFLTFAAGPENTLQGHAEPGDKRLEPGDIMRVDIVGFFAGYYTDLARMAVVGSPSAQVRSAYADLLKVQHGVIKATRPGVTAPQLYELAGNLMADTGRTLDMGAIGHSVGVFLHEYPNLETGSNVAIPKDAIVNIEISFEEPGIGGFHIEDTILVTDDIPVILSDQMDTTEIYVIR